MTCISPHRPTLYTDGIRRALNVSPATPPHSSQTLSYTRQPAADTRSSWIVLAAHFTAANLTTAARYKSSAIYPRLRPPPFHSAFDSLSPPQDAHHQHVFSPPHHQPGPPEALHHVITCPHSHLGARCCCSPHGSHPRCQRGPPPRKSSKMVSLVPPFIHSQC